MSKSFPEGCLFLDDDPSEIRAKIKKATMDASGTVNLRYLYKEFVSQTVPELNSELKEELSEALIEKFNIGGEKNETAIETHGPKI